MSRIIASAAIRGAHELAKEAREILAKAIEEKDILKSILEPYTQ